MNVARNPKTSVLQVNKHKPIYTVAIGMLTQNLFFCFCTCSTSLQSYLVSLSVLYTLSWTQDKMDTRTGYDSIVIYICIVFLFMHDTCTFEGNQKLVML